MDDYVVLINERNEAVGTSPKLPTHHNDTPLHRGFSVFLFNNQGQLLLQQRGKKKKTWPLVWSNSCCGHPMLQESPIAAAERRLSFELGITEVMITMMLPEYRYRCEKDGIVENEICPVMAAYSAQIPSPNTSEVEAVRWISWGAWVKEVQKNSELYSPWCVEETALLQHHTSFIHFLREATKKLPSK